MRPNHILRRLALAGAALTLLATPAAGHTATSEPPVIVDAAGDANNLAPAGEGIDTRPASDDRADIVRVWPETTYSTVTERAANGSILAVRHVPLALRINVRTTAPAKPATGPSLMFQFPFLTDGCYMGARFFVSGPLPANDPPEVAEIDDMPPDGVSFPGCIGSEIRSPGFKLEFSGNVTSMEFPFASLHGTAAENLIAPGLEMGTSEQQPAFIRVRSLDSNGADLLYGSVDKSASLPSSYTIASDVPADIDCMATPADPACQG
jgi:hypothetical protein